MHSSFNTPSDNADITGCRDSKKLLVFEVASYSIPVLNGERSRILTPESPSPWPHQTAGGNPDGSNGFSKQHGANISQQKYAIKVVNTIPSPTYITSYTENEKKQISTGEVSANDLRGNGPNENSNSILLVSQTNTGSLG